MQHPQPLVDQFFCLQRVAYQLGQAAIYLRQISKGLQITIYNKGLDPASCQLVEFWLQY